MKSFLNFLEIDSNYSSISAVGETTSDVYTSAADGLNALYALIIIIGFIAIAYLIIQFIIKVGFKSDDRVTFAQESGHTIALIIVAVAVLIVFATLMTWMIL